MISLKDGTRLSNSTETPWKNPALPALWSTKRFVASLIAPLIMTVVVVVVVGLEVMGRLT